MSRDLAARRTQAYDSLLDFAEGRGHREFPLLSPHYSPTSCVPCRDFSPWLRERFREGDRDALIEYVWRIRAANPGVGFGDDPKMIVRIFAPQVHRILDAPLEQYVVTSDPVVVEDLRTALLMLAPLDGFSGFTMAQKVPRYLAAVMLARAVRFQGMAELRRRAAAFVADMLKDTPFWENWSLPDPAVLESVTPPSETDDGVFRAVLGRLPLGARAHAIDASVMVFPNASNQAGPIAIALERATTYVTRQHGCEPIESAARILECGAFVPPDDPVAYLRGLTQRELVELGGMSAVPIKKSWAKDKLAATIAANAPDSARAAMTGHQVGMVAPQHARAAARALEWLDATIPAWSLVAAFAIPPENRPLG